MGYTNNVKTGRLLAPSRVYGQRTEFVHAAREDLKQIRFPHLEKLNELCLEFSLGSNSDSAYATPLPSAPLQNGKA